jgi:uncharacterized protein (UPF0332 family)
LKDNDIIWCFKQKRGTRIIDPNENLTKAYLKKTISALNTMTAALQIKETDWIITTAYYARYFALYALLMKLGIKSEIHDCSISVAKLLSKNGILNPNLVNDITKAKQTRIDTQYYVEKELNQTVIKNNVEAARKFVLEIEKTIEKLTTEQINSIRTQLKEAWEAAKPCDVDYGLDLYSKSRNLGKP